MKWSSRERGQKQITSTLVLFTEMVCMSQLSCTTYQAQRGKAQQQAQQGYSMPQSSSAQHGVSQLFCNAFYVESSGSTLGKAERISCRQSQAVHTVHDNTETTVSRSDWLPVTETHQEWQCCGERCRIPLFVLIPDVLKDQVCLQWRH